MPAKKMKAKAKRKAVKAPAAPFSPPCVPTTGRPRKIAKKKK